MPRQPWHVMAKFGRQMILLVAAGHSRRIGPGSRLAKSWDLAQGQWTFGEPALRKLARHKLSCCTLNYVRRPSALRPLRESHPFTISAAEPGITCLHDPHDGDGPDSRKGVKSAQAVGYASTASRTCSPRGPHEHLTVPTRRPPLVRAGAAWPDPFPFNHRLRHLAPFCGGRITWIPSVRGVAVAMWSMRSHDKKTARESGNYHGGGFRHRAGNR